MTIVVVTGPSRVAVVVIALVVSQAAPEEQQLVLGRVVELGMGTLVATGQIAPTTNLAQEGARRVRRETVNTMVELGVLMTQADEVLLLHCARLIKQYWRPRHLLPKLLNRPPKD